MLVDGKWISKWQPVETVDGKACMSKSAIERFDERPLMAESGRGPPYNKDIAAIPGARIITPLYLYRFRYYDQLRQRWLVARYRLQAPDIRCQYPEAELIGPAEVRTPSERNMLSSPPLR